MTTWLIIALSLCNVCGVGLALIVRCSKRRHDGGAYRQYKTMMAAHAKEGKNRAASRRKTRKHKRDRPAGGKREA